MPGRCAMSGVMLAAGLIAFSTAASAVRPDRIEHKLLATSKTSTMEKEMNEAAETGYRFASVMGGETAMGGSEVVIVMSRAGAAKPKYQYRLLATSKTSTMQKELQQAAETGFEYLGQTVFATAFGGSEVVCILERDREVTMPNVYEYVLLATSKTSTMEKELNTAGEKGFEVVGMTVGKTAMGGAELVSITRRKR